MSGVVCTVIRAVQGVVPTLQPPTGSVKVTTMVGWSVVAITQPVAEVRVTTADVDPPWVTTPAVGLTPSTRANDEVIGNTRNTPIEAAKTRVIKPGQVRRIAIRCGRRQETPDS